MTNFEDRIRDGLNNAPTRPPRPISNLQNRVRTIHHRRRVAATGVVLVAAAGVAFPFSMTGFGPSVVESPSAPTASTGRGASQEPGTEDAFPCDTYSTKRGGRPLALDKVPDHAKLLWDTSAAAAPTSAWAVDWSDAVESVTDRHPEGCVIPDDGQTGSARPAELALVQTDDDVVTNYITIYAPKELGAEHFLHLEPRTVETQAGRMYIIDDLGRVFWPADDDHYWSASYENPIGDAKLAELAESVRLREGQIDVGRWAAYHSVEATSRLDEHQHRGIEVRIDGPISATLNSDRGRRDLWRNAQIDDEVVDINGQPGLLTPISGHVDFLTDDNVLVQVRSHGLTRDELLAIARSIEQVPADDPRLADVWETDFDR